MLRSYCITFLFLTISISCFSQSDNERIRDKADSALQYCKVNNFDTTQCILIDMKIHSGKNRIFVWNFQKNEITGKSLCCHGCGQESTGAKPVFSNAPGSYCTSLGKYKIGVRAYSQYGINIHYKLHGLESSNNNAYKRIVVLHSFDPVPEKEIFPRHLPMGWSLGCPVISNNLMISLDEYLKKAKKPVLLWIYN